MNLKLNEQEMVYFILKIAELQKAGLSLENAVKVVYDNLELFGYTFEVSE